MGEKFKTKLKEASFNQLRPGLRRPRPYSAPEPYQWAGVGM